jgi:membrane-associated protease RseP (regulator of RpoE activity)
MVGFEFYDLVFLAIFIVLVVLFLTFRRKNLQRQGILFLYKTKLGIKFIDWFAKTFARPLKVLQYVVLVSGYALMVGIIWLLAKSTYLYLTTSIAQVIRAPPVFPVIPYFPKIFGLESLFPPLYFTYFIVALGIIAIVHEFSHGIFARLYNFKIHSTGFAFLGPILGAFVEPDEKQMEKAPRFKQMVVLAAGTFANVIAALFFAVVMILFFSNVFVPAGVKFSSYGLAELPMANITVIGNSSIQGYLELESNGKAYFIENEFWNISVERKLEKLIVYENTPAFRAQMIGAITEINGQEIKTIEDLRSVLEKHNPEDEVTIKTAVLEPGQGTVAETREYKFNLTRNSEGKAALGIVFIPGSTSGFSGWINKAFSEVKDPFIHYKSEWGNFGWFIYYLLWWIIVLNFLVALFNMLPLGILDGGKFFYLTVWAITGKEKIGKWAYKLITWFILALLVVMMIKWGLTFIK